MHHTITLTGNCPKTRIEILTAKRGGLCGLQRQGCETSRPSGSHVNGPALTEVACERPRKKASQVQAEARAKNKNLAIMRARTIKMRREAALRGKLQRWTSNSKHLWRICAASYSGAFCMEFKLMPRSVSNTRGSLPRCSVEWQRLSRSTAPTKIEDCFRKIGGFLNRLVGCSMTC